MAFSRKYDDDNTFLFQDPLFLWQVAMGLEVSMPRTGVSGIRVTSATGGTLAGQQHIPAAAQHHPWWALGDVWGGSFMQGRHCATPKPRDSWIPQKWLLSTSAEWGRPHHLEKAMPWLQVLDHHWQLTDDCLDTRASTVVGNHLSSQQEAWVTSAHIPGETEF